MEANLIKIDRNGSKHYEGKITCDRCNGRGWYATGSCNGQLVPSHVDNAVCYKCHGEGKVFGKWIERTPEYQAKLDARRQAKLEALRAKAEAERAEKERKEAEEKAKREAIIKAQKAISQHVGSIGERLTFKATFVRCASFEVPSFRGFGTDYMYINTFKDEAGNVFIWKTASGSIDAEYGSVVEVKGTVKEHSEYKDEKQTVLARCRIATV